MNVSNPALNNVTHICYSGVLSQARVLPLLARRNPGQWPLSSPSVASGHPEADVTSTCVGTYAMHIGTYAMFMAPNLQFTCQKHPCVWQ